MRVFDPKELDLWLPPLGARGTCPVQERFSVAGIFNICSYSSYHIRALTLEHRSVSMLWRTLGPKVIHEFSIPGKHCADLLILDPVDTSPKASMVMVHADLDTSSFFVFYLISKQTK